LAIVVANSWLTVGSAILASQGIVP